MRGKAKKKPLPVPTVVRAPVLRTCSACILVFVKTTPHSQHGKRPGGKTDPLSHGILRIATNLLSQDQVGIENQSYCTMFVFMLISLWTGQKPILRTYEMICYDFTSLTNEEEMIAHIAKLKRQDA